jgi:hypothetical protein
MATPEETRAGDSGGAEALESMSEGDAAPISGSEDHARATTSTDSADAASAAACEKTAAAPSDGSETLEALAALRVADDAGDESGDSPVVPPAPDVFDRLGYGDSASESGDANDGADASETCDARDDDDDESDDEYDDERETDDAATLFLDTIVAVADGEIPLDAPALGSMARALAREVGVVLEDDDLTLLADAPRAVQVAVRRVSDLALALTLAPPDSVRRAPGGALVNQPVAGSFRIVTLEIVAALVGCGITEAREAVARCPVRARGRDQAQNATAGPTPTTSGRDDSPRDSSVVLTPVTAAAAMLFAYEQSTPLQCAAARVLCAALTAAEEPAWAPLLVGGWGTAAAAERVAPPPASAEEAELLGLSLHARLAAVAEAAVLVRPGERRCGVGMAMIVAETLRDAHAEADAFEGPDAAMIAGADRASRPNRPDLSGSSDATSSDAALSSATSEVDDESEVRNDVTQKDVTQNDAWSKAKLRSALTVDKRWRGACDDDDGAFRRFERDVRGGLCGPRPSRGASIEDFASGMMGSPGGGGFAGGSMSGGDLLQVLQRLGGVGIAAQASPAQ